MAFDGGAQRPTGYIIETGRGCMNDEIGPNVFIHHTLTEHSVCTADGISGESSLTAGLRKVGNGVEKELTECVYVKSKDGNLFSPVEAREGRDLLPR